MKRRGQKESEGDLFGVLMSRYDWWKTDSRSQNGSPSIDWSSRLYSDFPCVRRSRSTFPLYQIVLPISICAVVVVRGSRFELKQIVQIQQRCVVSKLSGD